MKPAALTIALLLAACAKPAPQIQVQPIQCPPVPQCTDPRSEIRTNADLAAALIDTRAALAICQLARDTLQACINNQTKRPSE